MPGNTQDLVCKIALQSRGQVTVYPPLSAAGVAMLLPATEPGWTLVSPSPDQAA